MKLDVTVQRQSKIIIGIIVVVVTSFFVAFALAVGGLCLHLPNGSQMLGVGLASNDIFEPNTGNEHLVPIPYECLVGPLYTEPGSIELFEYNFPYYDLFTGEQLLPLPLCITNTMAQEWNFTIKVLGGYSPLDGGDWPDYGFTFWQDDNKDGLLTPDELVQGWKLDWSYVGKCPDDPCCSCDIWIAEIDWCANAVCLDSTEAPVLLGPMEGCTLTTQSDFELGKDVYFKISSRFEGGELEVQQFAVILAQKRCIFPNKHSPTPE
jgi:hypothetical protein